jgi:hypothetical protein
MPKRKNPAEGRTREVSVSMTEADWEELRKEAQRAGTSKSSLIYQRMVSNRPVPSKDLFETLRRISKVSVILDQLMRNIKAGRVHFMADHNLDQVTKILFDIRVHLLEGGRK